MKINKIYLICIILINCFFSNNMFGQTPNITDVEIYNITKLDTGHVVSASDTITIHLVNNGNDTVSNFPVFYEAFNSVVIETFTNSILPQQTATYTFSQSVNLTQIWNTTMSAGISVPNDNNPNNDTLQWLDNWISYDSIGTAYVSGQFILMYEDTVDGVFRDSIRQELKDAGMNVLDSVNCGNISIDLLSSPDYIEWESIIIKMETERENISNTRGGVKKLDFNVIISKTGLDNYADISPHLIENAISNQESILQQTNSSSTDPIKITILDTGLDNLPNAFKYDVICETCDGLPAVSNGYNFVDDNTNFDDDNDNNVYGVGHGTNVTRVITDFVYASAFQDNVKIIPLKVLNHDGIGCAWNVTEAILMSNVIRADLTVASLGWYGSHVSVIEELIERLADSCHGIFIASAGNDASDNYSNPHYPSNYTQDLDNVIAVAALDANLNFASYSNYGIIDIAAPGDILLYNHATGQTDTRSGTSYSAPFVAARVAWTFNRNPNASATQIRESLHNLMNYHNPVYDTLGISVISIHLGDTLTLGGYIDTITIDTNCRIQNCINHSIIDTTVSTSKIFIDEFHNITVLSYPNPFSDQIIFELEFATNFNEEMQFQIFDVHGRLVHLEYIPFVQNHYQLKWDGRTNGQELPSGIYYCSFLSGKSIKHTKILKLNR